MCVIDEMTNRFYGIGGHGLHLSVFSHLRECSVLCSLQYKMRFHLSYDGLKRNKTSSCIRLPVKVHFRIRIYSTYQRKLLSLISHLCKKVNRMHKKQPQNETIPK